MPILDTQYETMNRRDLRQLQLERFQAILNRVIRNVNFYQKWFKESGRLPCDFQSLEDLAKLPLINRQTLVENHPYGMFATPLRDVIRLHPSAPGVAEPIVIGYTQNDIYGWTRLKARGFAAAGLSQNDLVQVYLDYTLFPGAVIAHYGAEQLGACVTPLYNIQIADQIEIMINYRTTILICTPTRAIHIVRYMQETGIDPKSLFLRTLILVSESWTNQTRTQIEEALHVKAFGNYGVLEICSPGIAFECEHQCGLHINEDHFIPEIIDPHTGKVLPPGERGELVLTTLNREAFPLIRYRTGDVTTLADAPCACGRTLIRMENVASRTDDMIIIEGVVFLPAEVGPILAEIDARIREYRLLILRDGTSDRLEIEVEITPTLFQDRLGSLESLREKIEEAIYQRFRFKPIVRMMEPKSLVGKEKVVDLRERNL